MGREERGCRTRFLVCVLAPSLLSLSLLSHLDAQVRLPRHVLLFCVELGALWGEGGWGNKKVSPGVLLPRLPLSSTTPREAGHTEPLQPQAESVCVLRVCAPHVAMRQSPPPPSLPPPSPPTNLAHKVAACPTPNRHRQHHAHFERVQVGPFGARQFRRVKVGGVVLLHHLAFTHGGWCGVCACVGGMERGRGAQPAA